MPKLALLLYVILAPTAAGLLATAALVSGALAGGFGIAAAALAGAGSAWPLARRLARAAQDRDPA